LSAELILRGMLNMVPAFEKVVAQDDRVQYAILLHDAQERLAAVQINLQHAMQQTVWAQPQIKPQGMEMLKKISAVARDGLPSLNSVTKNSASTVSSIEQFRTKIGAVIEVVASVNRSIGEILSTNRRTGSNSSTLNGHHTGSVRAGY
jgi:RecA/RadA recombinase